MKKILCASGLFLLLSGCGSSPAPTTPVAVAVPKTVTQNFTLPKLPQISPEQNADTYIEKAQKFFVDSKKPSVREMRDSLLKGTNVVDQKVITDFLTQNKQMFEMLKKAAALPYYVDPAVTSLKGLRASTVISAGHPARQTIFYALQVKALRELSLEDAQALVLFGTRRQASSISIMSNLIGMANESAGLETVQFILKKKQFTKAQLTTVAELIRKLPDPFKMYKNTLLFDRQLTLNDFIQLGVDKTAGPKLDEYYGDFIQLVTKKTCSKGDSSKIPENPKTPGEIALRSFLPSNNTTRLCELVNTRNATIKLAESLMKNT